MQAPAEGGAEKAEGEGNWTQFIAFLQRVGNMSRSEVLGSPLIPLNATHKELSEIWVQEMTGRISSMFGVASDKSDRGRPAGNAESILGKPCYETPEEFLAAKARGEV